MGIESGVNKICFTCRLPKDTVNFKFDKKYPDGLYYECRKCTRNRVVALKATALSTLGSMGCLGCGVSDILVLTLDHILDDGSTSRSTDGLGETLYRRVTNGIVGADRLQVLCLNCNLKKHKSLVGARFSVAGFMAPRADSVSPDPDPDPAHGSHIRDFAFSDVTIGTAENLELVVAFFNQHHYAGYGRYGTAHFVANVGGEACAAVKFASAVRKEVASSIGLEYASVLELDRLCIHPSFRKKNLASYLLAACARLIRQMIPSITHLVSFADPEHGHTGTVYLAANWKEVDGSTRSDYRYEDASGKRVHKKTVWNSAKVRHMSEREYALASGLERVKLLPKRKFVLQIRP